jgi:hypothetical protein
MQLILGFSRRLNDMIRSSTSLSFRPVTLSLWLPSWTNWWPSAGGPVVAVAPASGASTSGRRQRDGHRHRDLDADQRGPVEADRPVSGAGLPSRPQ